MKIIEKGHKYKLATLDGQVTVELTFVKRFRGVENHAGTTSQEVIRCLIDRVQTLNAECPWDGNDTIINHLRDALILHECRALQRKVEKRQIKPENITTSLNDGHIMLKMEAEK